MKPIKFPLHVVESEKGKLANATGKIVDKSGETINYGIQVKDAHTIVNALNGSLEALKEIVKISENLEVKTLANDALKKFKG